MRARAHPRRPGGERRGQIHAHQGGRGRREARRRMGATAKPPPRDPKPPPLEGAPSALPAADVAAVFTVLRQLREEGLAIVFIPHRMHETAELADDCSVYRNGCHVATFTAGSKSPSEIIEMMIGRDVKSVFPPRPAEKSTQPPVLKVTNLAWAGRLKNIDFEERPGED